MSDLKKSNRFAFAQENSVKPNVSPIEHKDEPLTEEVHQDIEKKDTMTQEENGRNNSSITAGYNPVIKHRGKYKMNIATTRENQARFEYLMNMNKLVSRTDFVDYVLTQALREMFDDDMEKDFQNYYAEFKLNLNE